MVLATCMVAPWWGERGIRVGIEGGYGDLRAFCGVGSGEGRYLIVIQYWYSGVLAGGRGREKECVCGGGGGGGSGGGGGGGGDGGGGGSGGNAAAQQQQQEQW